MNKNTIEAMGTKTHDGDHTKAREKWWMTFIYKDMWLNGWILNGKLTTKYFDTRR